jgi:D-alanyl-D-alanine carboxypeptidase
VRRTRVRRRWLPLVVVTVAAASGCGSTGTTPTTLALERPGLKRMLCTLAHEQHVGAVALAQSDQGVWRGACGFREGKRPAEPDDRFGIASTTKTFVATVVLQLVGEGRLSLEDKVEHWLPGRIRGGREIAVRQLLNHTSGLSPGFPSALPPRSAQPPLLSRPGTTYEYSNTNYVALGLVVEKVTGHQLAQVVRDRLLRPLNLTDTSYGTAAPPARTDPPPAWLGGSVESMGRVSGDGGIVSSAADLARFFRALVGGDLLGKHLLSEMMRSVDTGTEFRAGLGLFRIELPCGLAWGHGGDSSTYSNQVLAAPDASHVVVVAQNEPDWAGPRATAEEMYCRLGEGRGAR